MKELLGQICQAKLYDLARSYFVGMPHFPTHPPFLFGLTKKHGDLVTEGGVSSAADAIALGSHVGTHIDALCHFSCGGSPTAAWRPVLFRAMPRAFASVP